MWLFDPCSAGTKLWIQRGCGGTHHLPGGSQGVRAERGAVRECQSRGVRTKHRLRALQLRASYPPLRGPSGWAALPEPLHSGVTGHPLSCSIPHRLLVGAPLQTGDVNETGKVYKCDPGSRRCQEIPIQRRGTLCCGVQWACGPTVHRVCGENMYINGYCFLLDQSLQQRQCIPDTLAECPRHATDIALLIDGSGSIRPYDFGKMNRFLSEIMKRFRSIDTQFALMQYSDEFKQHFDFSQYRRSRNPDSLVRSVEQLRGTTHTASAIRKVVRELFTSRKGARDETTKILIVITDGEKTEDPLSYSDVIPEAERAGIIRYAIGVGQAFSSAAAQLELQEIASQPSNEHVFRVDNFDALQGIQNQLQEKIFAIEGTRAGGGSPLPSVGAYDWSGGIYLYGSSGKPSFINVSKTSTDMFDTYLGYSSQVITGNGQSSYVVGAPRYQHAGKVVLFSRDTKGGEWTHRSEVLGEQIGSYFGGTLCAVDLDRDGNTDLVLVGAPTYYTPLNGGRVYICLIDWPRMTLNYTEILQGQTGQVFGRFGASMSEIGDISGDGLMDVAIGAPMESNNHGALYIFHGGKGGLSPQYRQRIEGSLFPSRLHYFGRAVSGGTDLTGDGLPDIAVGAQGQVLLLRSRPVLRVGVSISFQPPTIPTSAFNCQEQEQLNTEASRAEVCFTVTKSNGISSTIHYSLSLDSGRTKIRAAFDSTGPVLSRELQLGIEKKCETYQIKLPLCPEDTLTPITLRLNYTLTGEPIAAAGRLRPILSEDSALVSAGSVRPPEPGSGDCLQSSPLSLPLSLSTLVVGITPELTTTVSIQNRGENSYSTGVQFFYPAALSYRRVLLLQVPPSPSRHSQRPVALHGVIGASTDCKGRAPPAVPFPVEQRPLLDMTPHHHSPAPSITLPSLLFLPSFPFPSLEESTKYVNFSTEEAGTSVPVTHRCEVRPVAQSVRGKLGKEGGTPAHPLPHLAISFRPQDCSVATCKKIRCRIASLEMQQPLEFMIKGNVSFQWVSQTQQQKVSLVSEARIEYEEKKYTQKEGFVQRQVQTVVERSEAYNYLPIIVGSSVGGLVLLALITAALYKVREAGLGPLPHCPSPWGRGLWLSQLVGEGRGYLLWGLPDSIPPPGVSPSTSVRLAHTISPLFFLPVRLLQAPVQAEVGG
uniref:VWFA domain-containing protein n=1 Tax=Chrysemys picta bellii TaxID=8478 RepID=A0A8C3FWT0_CHRPI